MCGEDSGEVEQECLTPPSSMPDSTSLTTSDTGSDNRASEKNILQHSHLSQSLMKMHHQMVSHTLPGI
uniref:Uncharacterized protein n=1 Tax=Amphimedon queenslandica TaxID=400682 RepID=A0A1X7T8H6_AMPQE